MNNHYAVTDPGKVTFHDLYNISHCKPFSDSDQTLPVTKTHPIINWAGDKSLPNSPSISSLNTGINDHLPPTVNSQHDWSSPVIQSASTALKSLKMVNIMPSKEGESATVQRQFTEKGGQYLKGRFTFQEKERLRQAIIRYVEEHDLGSNGIQLLCAKERRPELRGAWATIASVVPQRSVSSCYHFCTRAFSARSTGRWTEKDIDLLRDMVAKHGRKWTVIGALIKRLPCSCRDKWRLIEKKNLWSLNDDNLLICHVMANSEVVSKDIGKHSQQEAMKRWVSRYRDLIFGEKRQILTRNDVILLEKVIDMNPVNSLDIHWPDILPVGDWPGAFCMWRWEIISRFTKMVHLQRPAKVAEWMLNNMVMQNENCRSDPSTPDGSTNLSR